MNNTGTAPCQYIYGCTTLFECACKRIVMIEISPLSNQSIMHIYGSKLDIPWIFVIPSRIQRICSFPWLIDKTMRLKCFWIQQAELVIGPNHLGLGQSNVLRSWLSNYPVHLTSDFIIYKFGSVMEGFSNHVSSLFLSKYKISYSPTFPFMLNSQINFLNL